MIDFPSLTERLGSVPHFQSLSESDRMVIVSSGQILHFPAGSTIFHGGKPSAGLYVLFKGQVNLCKLSLQGQESIIAVIRPVIMFNEVSAVDGGPNPVTAVAAQDCATWRIDHEHFTSLMGRFPSLGTGLLRVLVSRNRLLIAHYEDLICRPVRARTAKILLDLSKYGQKPISRRRHSNQELAARVATSPEALSRSLRELRDSDAIECTRAHITILSAEQLADLAYIQPEMFKV